VLLLDTTFWICLTKTISSLGSAIQASAMAGAVFLPSGSSKNLVLGVECLVLLIGQERENIVLGLLLSYFYHKL